MADTPPLRRLHSDATLAQRRYKSSLEFWRKRSTEQIVASLPPRRGEPDYQEFLKVRDDGLAYQGNTRIKVLEERGYNLNGLPRFPLDS